VPQPPSLHLPRVVTDLTALRAGKSVHLHWTTPARTTDGLNVPAPLIAEVCRQESAPMGNPAAARAGASKSAGGNPRDTQRAAPQSIPGCDIVLHLTVKPGATDADDSLPSDLTSDPVRVLGYRVRILNSKGHSAGLSLAAFAAAGDAPAPVTGLRATAQPDGALVEWQPADENVVVELDRRLTTPPAAKRSEKRPGLGLSEEQPAEIRLRTAKEDDSTKDPGGLVDRTAARGQQYSYRAQRIRVAYVDGNRVEIRSTLSAPADLTMRDRFAPSAPTGLASIIDMQEGKAVIDLSWQASTEMDLAGYNVYRRLGSSGQFTRLTNRPIPGPAFSDAAVKSTTTYTYRVTAVDNDGNESKPSDEITETARPQQ